LFVLSIDVKTFLTILAHVYLACGFQNPCLTVNPISPHISVPDTY